MMVQASTHMGIFVSIVAGPSYFDTGQLSHFITYLFLIYFPISFIIFICHSAIPENPAS
jgi:hypothetical protein